MLNVPGCLQDSLGNPIHWKKASKGRVDGYASTKINACAKSFLHVTVWCNWRGCCPRGFHHLPLRGDYRISCRTKGVCADFIVVVQQSICKVAPF